METALWGRCRFTIDLQSLDPDKVRDPVLANRMHFLKETKDGMVIIEDTFLELAKLTNQARDEELQEARETIAYLDSEIAARNSEIARLKGLLMAHGIMP